MTELPVLTCATPPFPAASILGYPRIGRRRELKKAVEAYWAGTIDAAALDAAAKEIQLGTGQAPAGPGPDRSGRHPRQLLLLRPGARHQRHGRRRAGPLRRLLRRRRPARPRRLLRHGPRHPGRRAAGDDQVVRHQLPLPGAGTRPRHRLRRDLGKQIVERVRRGPRPRASTARPVSSARSPSCCCQGRAPTRRPTSAARPASTGVLPVYAGGARRICGRPAPSGSSSTNPRSWARTARPPSPGRRRPRLPRARRRSPTARGCSFASYCALGGRSPVLATTAIDGLALTSSPGRAANLATSRPPAACPARRLVAGVVDGRNVWINDLAASAATLADAARPRRRGRVAPSSSLLHVPHDVDDGTRHRPAARPLAGLRPPEDRRGRDPRRACCPGTGTIAANRRQPRRPGLPRHRLPRRDPASAAPRSGTAPRPSPTPTSAAPRTGREARAGPARLLRCRRCRRPPSARSRRPASSAPPAPRPRAGRSTPSGTNSASKAEIRDVDRASRRELGLDVLVHGEPERNDMVQYFAEQLDGFVATAARLGPVLRLPLRPPADPVRATSPAPRPMTVRWTPYAQSLTDRPVKGMLTGPVTMLAWSFVRDDQPLGDTAARWPSPCATRSPTWRPPGIRSSRSTSPRCASCCRCARPTRPPTWTGPSRRSGSPPRGVRARHPDPHAPVLLGVRRHHRRHRRPRRRRHHHRGRPLPHGGRRATSPTPTASAARSGPGVYDIHSPRVPGDAGSHRLLSSAVARPARQLWVNPDCGLKTRGYAETEESLRNLVTATKTVRAGLLEAAK